MRSLTMGSDPINDTSSVKRGDVTRTLRAGPGKARLSISLRATSRSTGWCSAMLPPMTMTCGLSAFTRLAHSTPTATYARS